MIVFVVHCVWPHSVYRDGTASDQACLAALSAQYQPGSNHIICCLCCPTAFTDIVWCCMSMLYIHVNHSQAHNVVTACTSLISWHALAFKLCLSADVHLCVSCACFRMYSSCVHACQLLLLDIPDRHTKCGVLDVAACAELPSQDLCGHSRLHGARDHPSSQKL